MKTGIRLSAKKAFVKGSFQPRSILADAAGIRDIPAHTATVRLDERYLLLPGLINAHDHLEFNSLPLLGRPAGYQDVYEWAAEVKERWSSPEIRECVALPMEDRLRIGGFKNLISGVTTVAHHNPYHTCFEQGFPTRVVRNYAWSHSLGLDPKALETFEETPPDVPWIIHVAEGTSERAQREIDELDRRGALAPNAVLVHMLGAQIKHFELLAERGASVVTCPVSNRYLYGQTLDFDRLPSNLKIALGSDSAASSSSGLLEDIQMLRDLAPWTEEEIWTRVTSAAAEILKIEGQDRDFVVLKDHDPALVVIDGRAIYGDQEFRHFFEDGTRRISVREKPKLISKSVRIPWRSLARAAEWTPYLQEIRF